MNKANFVMKATKRHAILNFDMCDWYQSTDYTLSNTRYMQLHQPHLAQAFQPAVRPLPNASASTAWQPPAADNNRRHMMHSV